MKFKKVLMSLTLSAIFVLPAQSAFADVIYEREPNNTHEDAQSFRAHQDTVVGHISDSVDKDYYKFTNASGKLAVRLILSSQDYDLVVFKKDVTTEYGYVLMGVSSNVGTKSEVVQLRDVKPTDEYVVSVTFYRNYDPNASYQVMVERSYD